MILYGIDNIRELSGHKVGSPLQLLHAELAGISVLSQGCACCCLKTQRGWAYVHASTYLK